MTERDFCYWLQGAFELGLFDDGVTKERAQIIKNHLNLVFIHSIDTPDHDGKLQEVHDGTKTGASKNELEKQLKDIKWNRPPGARC